MTLRSSFHQVAVVVVLVLVVLGTTGVGAGSGLGHTSADSDVTQIGEQKVTITDEHVTVHGVHISGPALPAIDIQDRTYTIHDVSLMVNGLTVTYNGQTYEICSILIVLDNISVTVENVQTSPT